MSFSRWYPMRRWREPTLKELLSEPIIRALMDADGVDPEEGRSNAPASATQKRARQILYSRIISSPAGPEKLNEDITMEFACATPISEQVLLQELNHRIGNEFFSAMTLVSLAAARSRSKKVKVVLSGITELLLRADDQELYRASLWPRRGQRPRRWLGSRLN
jgi:two-component sensor histidine kinase